MSQYCHEQGLSMNVFFWPVTSDTSRIRQSQFTQVASHVIIHVGTIENQKMCATALQACLLLGIHVYLDNVHIYITTKNILTIALSSELQPTDMVSCLQYCHYNVNVTLILSCSSSKIYRI